MKKLAMALALLAVAPVAAQGSVTLYMACGTLYKADGTTPLPGDPSGDTTNEVYGSTVVLLGDADNDGSFGDLTQATDSWKADPDDLVLGRWETNDWGGPGVTYPDPAAIFDIKPSTQPDDTMMNQDEKLLLVFYDVPFDAGAAGPGELKSFGTYRTDDIMSGSSIPWNVPQDGAGEYLYMVTIAAGGDVAEIEGKCDMTTVPEPATMLLTLGGLCALVRRRRA